MKKLFNTLRVKSESNELLDLVVSLLEEQDWNSIKLVSEDCYSCGDATISIKYFDADAFEEIQISFGYSIGKGITIVLRNYIEHLVVINHEILDEYHTIEFPVRTDAFGLQDYREKLDAIATNVIAAVEQLGASDGRATSLEMGLVGDVAV